MRTGSSGPRSSSEGSSPSTSTLTIGEGMQLSTGQAVPELHPDEEGLEALRRGSLRFSGQMNWIRFAARELAKFDTRLQAECGHEAGEALERRRFVPVLDPT